MKVSEYYFGWAGKFYLKVSDRRLLQKNLNAFALNILIRAFFIAIQNIVLPAA